MKSVSDFALHWDGPGNPFVDGRIGKGLWLRGPELKDYAMIPDYPQARQGQLSLSAWVYAESRPFAATIVKNWGDEVGGQFELSLRGNRDGHGIDFGVEVVPSVGKGALLREGESHPFPLHEWEHVAFVADGSMLRLYRQGHEVGAMPCDGVKFPVAQRSLGIGVTINDANSGASTNLPSFWDGKLDEIAIFNKALTADQIKQLAAAPPR